jgi:hypothetical protein
MPVFRDPPGFYALEKLSQAVQALATGAGRVQERLGEAAMYLIRIRPDEIPIEELRRILVGIKGDLTFDEPVGNEGRLVATLRGLDDADASAIETRIVHLHDRLSKLLMG